MVDLRGAVNFFAYSGLFGVTCYQSFFAGIVAYRALPVEMFGKLQHRVFPGYFKIQTALTAVVLATVPFQGDNKIEYSALAVNLISALYNLLYIMPRAHVIIEKREEQQKIEGKGYKDPDASQTMKDLNAAFAALHAKSMIANVAVIVGTFTYGTLFALHLPTF